MAGFCPDDWHGTTEEDLIQMAWGEDYIYSGHHPDNRYGLGGSVWSSDPYIIPGKPRDYKVHDEAIRLAKLAGKAFHELPEPEQNILMDIAEATTP